MQQNFHRVFMLKVIICTAQETSMLQNHIVRTDTCMNQIKNMVL